MRAAAVLLPLALLCACAPRKAAPAPAGRAGGFKPLAELRDVPGLGEPRRIEPGVLFHEVVLPREQATRRLWVYLPERPQAGRLPCVFVAPAGSNLFTGNELGEGDRPEHLPYVREGFAVVAYELDGPLRQGARPTDRELAEAYEAFRAAEAGVANARMAMDYALAKIPQIDPGRLYVAGHSSAATLALLVAEREPRVKACAAYAPVTDVAAHFGPRAVGQLSALPGFGDFLRDYSPINGAARLTVPLFLFSADDDSNVPPEQSARFAAAVGKVNRDVTYVRVPVGDHYDSMIAEGVPRAVEWLRGLGRPGRER